MHVANNYGADIYVLASPNADWALAELLTDATLITTPVGQIAVAAHLARLPQTIRTVSDLYQFLKVGSKLGNGAFADGTQPAKELTALIDQFKKNSTKIPPDSVVNVFDHDAVDMYMTPIGWGGIFGASTATLTILADSVTVYAERTDITGDVAKVDSETQKVNPRSSQFNTGPDDSWIATPSGIVRAKYGDLWVEDPESGSHSW
ncbi:hypothetical protein [Streptomyces flavidovirens]|uniref:Uncharacterized protein n=1 Tax=Streptomyces flavidovirens TaxID=67298 RepID=A0ABW6RPZ0_9ACTN